MSLTIGITTFSKRFELVKNLLYKIRQINKSDKIILCINGEKDGLFDEEYRKQILSLCIVTPNVYPIFFTEIRGLSKMWNTIVIHSDTENILMLNDDLNIFDETLFDQIYNHLGTSYSGFSRINRSFSHFLVSKKTIHDLDYFDERLLGFGEEDGDIYYRAEARGVKILDVNIDGFFNIVSDIRHDQVIPGIGKYSKFNRDFIYKTKYTADPSSPYKGMFDYNMRQHLSTFSQYPFEEFFRENKKLL